MKTTIILVRHGETSWNKKKKLQGQIDIPLSKTGLRQANLVAKRIKILDITKIYSSKLKRAIQTASVISRELNLPFVIDEGLNERAYGEHQGKNWKDIQHYYKNEKTYFNHFKPDGGESNIEFGERVVFTLDRIIDENKGKKILIVCHGGVIHALARHLRKIPHEQITNFHFPNTSLTIYHIDKEKITEELFADAEHIK